jgi:hypothetical protein
MSTWREHFPITHFVLHALLHKRSGDDGADLSRTEAVLLAVCRFWAAAAERKLASHLEPDPVATLLTGFEAFSEVGAVRVASTLRVALGECPAEPPARWLQACALELEDRLLNTDDAMDHLIAQFASAHMPVDAFDAHVRSV